MVHVAVTALSSLGFACATVAPTVESRPAVVVAPVCPPNRPHCSTKPLPAEETLAAQPVASFRDMVEVPGGAFIMGCDTQDPHCEEDERPLHRVILDRTFIDRTEVTASAYRACVVDGACREPGKETECTFGVEDRSDHPVNCVDWSQASEFCRWAGKRLPTEAEWERAARGVEGGLYPWGNEPEASCTHAVMVEDGGNGCGTDQTWPVGSKPKGLSPVGALDMAGNVWEWTADWYAHYSAGSQSVNPRGPDSGTERVIKGGSWDDQSGAPILRAAARVGNAPETSGRYLGFRCASDVP
jgi:formylglycine-generating enzyme required for sulfatase activity